MARTTNIISFRVPMLDKEFLVEYAKKQTRESHEPITESDLIRNMCMDSINKLKEANPECVELARQVLEDRKAAKAEPTIQENNVLSDLPQGGGFNDI